MTTAHVPVSGILRMHKQWLENPDEGRRANFTGVTLNEAAFAGADLRDAIFQGSTMLDANLAGAIFEARKAEPGGFAASQSRRGRFNRSRYFASGLRQRLAAGFHSRGGYGERVFHAPG